VPEYGLTVIELHMLVEPNARASSGDRGCERCLADHERIAAQVVAVQLDEVEGIEEHAVVMIAVADAIE
jgi:hypothetical protein